MDGSLDYFPVLLTPLGVAIWLSSDKGRCTEVMHVAFGLCLCKEGSCPPLAPLFFLLAEKRTWWWKLDLPFLITRCADLMTERVRSQHFPHHVVYIALDCSENFILSYRYFDVCYIYRTWSLTNIEQLGNDFKLGVRRGYFEEGTLKPSS